MSEWLTTTTTSVQDSLTASIGFIPRIIAALIVVLIGVIVAWAVKTIIIKALGFIKVKKYTDSVGLDKVFPATVGFASLLGDIAQWTIVIVFLIPAFDILNLGAVNTVLVGILNYIPNVIVAVVIMLVGIVIADLADRVVSSAAVTIGTKASDILGTIAKWAVVAFAVFAALIQLGIAQEMLLSLWQGFIYFFVLAGAIAFGLGGKDAAADLISGLRKQLPKK